MNTDDHLQSLKPWARRLMQTRLWWLLLVAHAICSPLPILAINAWNCLRESWRDYAWLFFELRAIRRVELLASLKEE